MGRDGAVRPAQMVLRTPLVDEIALWVIEQRPILNTTVSLSLDLGVEFLLHLGFDGLPRESMSAVTAVSRCRVSGPMSAY